MNTKFVTAYNQLMAISELNMVVGTIDVKKSKTVPTKKLTIKRLTVRDMLRIIDICHDNLATVGGLNELVEAAIIAVSLVAIVDKIETRPLATPESIKDAIDQNLYSRAVQVSGFLVAATEYALSQTLIGFAGGDSLQKDTVKETKTALLEQKIAVHMSAMSLADELKTNTLAMPLADYAMLVARNKINGGLTIESRLANSLNGAFSAIDMALFRLYAIQTIEPSRVMNGYRQQPIYKNPYLDAVIETQKSIATAKRMAEVARLQAIQQTNPERFEEIMAAVGEQKRKQFYKLTNQGGFNGH